MRFNSHRFNEEIVDFLSVETLEAIDYGILNLSNIEDLDLKEVFYFFEELLTLELKVNYFENNTGIFRVQYSDGIFYYREFGHVIKANSLNDLKELVLEIIELGMCLMNIWLKNCLIIMVTKPLLLNTMIMVLVWMIILL